eukprot:CAMPEP_0114558360 /NCGR_PEP_ID=MMETSP0114-20121206/10338_1 /TAXON_ID=31324 /ORGANISM="Goniomonas sp, Strain m" /LENGTH=108 /DNA_ID=CAMNT_0001743741 /DNA_START=253 /DNA_END=579 /DNA_ORIENTATION=+
MMTNNMWTQGIVLVGLIGDLAWFFLTELHEDSATVVQISLIWMAVGVIMVATMLVLQRLLWWYSTNSLLEPLVFAEQPATSPRVIFNDRDSIQKVPSIPGEELVDFSR